MTGKPSTFYAAHLQATFGGWVLFRDGMFFASKFANPKEAKKYAMEFCQANGVPFVWSK